LLLCSLFPCSLFVFCSSFFHLVLAFCLLSCVCCPSSFSSFFVIGFGSCSGAFFFCCSYKCYHYYVSVVFLLCFPFSLCILFLYWPSFLIGIWFLLLFSPFCVVCLFIVFYYCSLFFVLILIISSCPLFMIFCSCHSLLVWICCLMLINVVVNIFFVIDAVFLCCTLLLIRFVLVCCS
jgi:hypothetical protein